MYRQPLRLLKRNLNVEVFRFNRLKADIPISEERKIVIQVVAKYQHVPEMLMVTNYPIFGKLSFYRAMVFSKTRKSQSFGG